jgi:orotidine-5'-phosphate decarboxylase
MPPPSPRPIPAERLLVALDTTDLERAIALAEALKGAVGGIKIGLELYSSSGVEGVRALAALGLPIFLDFKLHDIPNTVASAVRAILPLKPFMLTVHAAGGAAMLRAAAAAATEAQHARPRLVAVTVLTSLDAEDLARVGQAGPVAEQVLRLAALARDAGIDGAVCSPQEVALLRHRLGAGFTLVVPGIRPAWAAPASGGIDD